jgi:hypothetical protein
VLVAVVWVSVASVSATAAAVALLAAAAEAFRELVFALDDVAVL